jgi:hypothetical protein
VLSVGEGWTMIGIGWLRRLSFGLGSAVGRGGRALVSSVTWGGFV